MKRLLVAVLFVTMLCLPALAQKKGADDFNDLINRYYTAWSTLNPDNASVFYAKDADLVFFDIDPLKYLSWQQYHDNFKNNVAPGFSSLTITPGKDLKVMRKANITLTILTFHLSAKQKDGTPVEFDGRHTAVWEKRGGQWLIIHEHVSKPLS